MKINRSTRQSVLDFLRVSNTCWSGRLDESEFLSRIFDLETLPSLDSRFTSAAGDIWQHRINNPMDWPDDWIYADHRFNLMGCDDEVFLKFLCEMLHPIIRPDSTEVANLLQMFNEVLSSDGVEIVEISRISNAPVFAARLRVVGHPTSLKVAKTLVASMDASYISQQITRMESSVEHDPELAIGTAKELVETCCKTILNDRGLSFNADWDVIRLVKETCSVLKLTPRDIPDAAKHAETIKRLLGNLANVGQGLAELRNPFGTGHGKPASTKGLSPRHAKLAVGAASTLAIFLFETDSARSTDG